MVTMSKRTFYIEKVSPYSLKLYMRYRIFTNWVTINDTGKKYFKIFEYTYIYIYNGLVNVLF